MWVSRPSININQARECPILMKLSYCVEEDEIKTHSISAIATQKLVGPHQQVLLRLRILQDQALSVCFKPVIPKQTTTVGCISSLDTHPEFIDCKVQPVQYVCSDLLCLFIIHTENKVSLYSTEYCK